MYADGVISIPFISFQIQEIDLSLNSIHRVVSLFQRLYYNISVTCDNIQNIVLSLGNTVFTSKDKQ